MLTSSFSRPMILDLLMLITLLNVGLIVYPDGLQVKATSTESNSKVSAVRDNNTDVPHGANLSDTLPLLAIFPEGTQISPFGFNTDGEGKLQIEILFNKPVDTSTVIPGSSLILAMETNPKATVTMKWDLNNRFLTIVTDDLLYSLCHYNPNCNFALRLDGTDPNAIRAADGSLLNGGFDDYWAGFVIVG